MTKRQAAAALEEYLAERPLALQRLRDEMTADGLKPDTVLDGTPESLTPLWRWVETRIMPLKDHEFPTDPDAPAPRHWPSWARHTWDLRRRTPDEVVFLLDGVVSYLGEVVTTHALGTVWRPGQHRIKAYMYYHHPVLAGPATDNDGQIYLPNMVAVTATRQRYGLDPLGEDRITAFASRVITALRGEAEPVPEVDEPLIEVDSDDGEEFDVGLRDDLAHEHSRQMDRMVKELKKQPGVNSAHREDRDMLLVRAPDWAAEDLEQWLIVWINRHVPAVR